MSWENHEAPPITRKEIIGYAIFVVMAISFCANIILFCWLRDARDLAERRALILENCLGCVPIGSPW